MSKGSFKIINIYNVGHLNRTELVAQIRHSNKSKRYKVVNII